MSTREIKASEKHFHASDLIRLLVIVLEWLLFSSYGNVVKRIECYPNNNVWIATVYYL
jgi:hypothetical protein